MTTRVILVDDHDIVLEGIHKLLEPETEFEVIAKVTNGSDAVQVSQKLAPDMVVMDITMPGMGGIEATRRIIADRPAVKVLCLSMHADRGFVMAALEAGASGFALKDTAKEELLHAIYIVMKGQIYLSPGVAAVVVDAATSKHGAGDYSSLAQLTARERQVLQVMTQGETTKQIARKLNLSVKTIATHRMHIMDKLDIHSVAGLTKFAIREGITSADD
jgi:DNA-binding NarL/FixJ family response regulator